MQKTYAVLLTLLMTMPVSRTYADIASTSYVDNISNTKISTESTANQTMAGEYTVTGTLKVPTQPLPSAE